MYTELTSKAGQLIKVKCMHLSYRKLNNWMKD